MLVKGTTDIFVNDLNVEILSKWFLLLTKFKDVRAADMIYWIDSLPYRIRANYIWMSNRILHFCVDALIHPYHRLNVDLVNASTIDLMWKRDVILILTTKVGSASPAVSWTIHITFAGWKWVSDLNYQSGRSPKVVALFSATNISSNITWFFSTAWYNQNEIKSYRNQLQS